MSGKVRLPCAGGPAVDNAGSAKVALRAGMLEGARPSDRRWSAVGAAEFAALVTPLGPFGACRRVMVGVSGGADSLALALLLRGWGEPVAAVVDHGLRPGSRAEAELTLRRLAAMGLPSRLLTLSGLRAGPDLGARARAARYDALLGLCHAEGCPDLFIAHHAQDQAETVLLRTASGSSAAGLAAMAAVSWRSDARIVRPLLSVAPERLRATLHAAGIGWVDDPTNRDPATARGALRSRTIATEQLAELARVAGQARGTAEAALAVELGERVTLYPTGHAEVDGPLTEAGWSALLSTVSGRVHPPQRAAVARLAKAGAGTLHGVMVRNGLVVREAVALGPAVPARAGAVWDGRFALGTTVVGAELSAMLAGSAGLRRRRGLPSAVLRTLPVLRFGMEMLMVSHVVFPYAESWPSVRLEFRPARPLAGASFARLTG